MRAYALADHAKRVVASPGQTRADHGRTEAPVADHRASAWGHGLPASRVFSATEVDAGPADAGPSGAGGGGPAVDAGPADAGAPGAGGGSPAIDAGAPGAGGGSPAPGGGGPAIDAGAPPAGAGGSPPPPGPLPALNLLRVEVEPASRGQFPSIPGTGAGTHWVGVASTTAPRPLVQAVFDSPASPDDPRVAGLAWSGPDVVADPGNPLRAEVARTAAKRVVTATLGGSSASTTLWSVFARVNLTGGPTASFAMTPLQGDPSGDVGFSATILPATIITDADRPDLSGRNDTDPPGGTHWTGDPLSGGADRHWDFSRKMRTKILNPSAIPFAALDVPGEVDGLAVFGPAQPINFPATWEEGNDDRTTDDEQDNPYAGPMTSGDHPEMPLAHAGGADGDTFEIRLQFCEFVRLELKSRWWVISALKPWRVHFKLRKAAGSWVDDGSNAASDNAGF
jgi:hypothetical protein